MSFMRYDIYKWKNIKSLTDKYELVHSDLTYKQAMKFMKDTDKPSDYLVQPYREGTNERET